MIFSQLNTCRFDHLMDLNQGTIRFQIIEIILIDLIIATFILMIHPNLKPPIPRLLKKIKKSIRFPIDTFTSKSDLRSLSHRDVNLEEMTIHQNKDDILQTKGISNFKGIDRTSD